MEELRLGKLLFETTTNFKNTVRAKVNSAGIPSSYFLILLFMGKNKEKEVNQQDIVNFACFKPSTISITLSNMENDGYIVRIKDKKDSRKIIVKLTQKGKEVGLQIKNIFDEIEKDLSKSMSNKELEDFISSIDKINKILKGDEADA